MAEQLTRLPRAGGREFVSQKPVKSYAVLQTVRHRFNIYAGTAVLPWRYDTEMGTPTRYTLGAVM